MQSELGISQLAPPARASMSLQRGLLTVAVLSTCALIMAMDYADPDLWGHVLYGQEILRDGVLPETTTWSFTSSGYRWINHENIAELVMAATVNQFGSLGLSLGKYLIGCLMIGLIWWRARAANVSLLVISLITLVVAISIQFHWHFRPQIFGYLFFGVMCALLHWCFESVLSESASVKRLLHLFWLVPLMSLWASTHGSFAAGLCVVFASLGLRMIEIILYHFWNKRSSVPTVRSSQIILLILPAVGLSCLLATLLNPYGSGLYQWLWSAISIPRPEIGDWESPSLFSFSREVIGFWVMVISIVLVMKFRLRQNWVNAVVFALLAMQAVSHIRHLPLVAIFWGSCFAKEIDRLWQRLLQDYHARLQIDVSAKAQQSSKIPLLQQPVFVTSLLGIWIVGVAAATAPRVATLRVPKEMYPVDALKFIAEHRLEGRTVVTFNWAQYAIGFFSNEQLNSTVAFDGRFRTCYPQEVIDIYFDFLFGEHYSGPRYRSPKSGPIDSSLALRYKDPELFLISRKQRSSVMTLQQHEQDFALLYEDDLAQIWGKRNRYPDSDRIFSLGVLSRQHAQNSLSSAEPWPAFASHSAKRNEFENIASRK